MMLVADGIFPMGSSSAKMISGSQCGWISLFLIVVFVAGCGPKQPVEVYPPASSRDAVQRARDILSLYAGGQPVGSESIGFDLMVEDVRKVDATVAETLEKGLAEITARPAAARVTATRLLEQLPASAAAAAAAVGLGPAP
jgi:hypothetical protein